MIFSGVPMMSFNSCFEYEENDGQKSVFYQMRPNTVRKKADQYIHLQIFHFTSVSVLYHSIILYIHNIHM